LNIKCVLISLQLLSVTFLIVRRTERDVIRNVQLALCKVPVIFVSFLSYLNFLDGFSKNLYISQLHVVTQLVEALRYKPECLAFDFRWCHLNYSLT